MALKDIFKDFKKHEIVMSVIAGLALIALGYLVWKHEQSVTAAQNAQQQEETQSALDELNAELQNQSQFGEGGYAPYEGSGGSTPVSTLPSGSDTSDLAAILAALLGNNSNNQGTTSPTGSTSTNGTGTGTGTTGTSPTSGTPSGNPPPVTTPTIPPIPPPSGSPPPITTGGSLPPSPVSQPVSQPLTVAPAHSLPPAQQAVINQIIQNNGGMPAPNGLPPPIITGFTLGGSANSSVPPAVNSNPIVGPVVNPPTSGTINRIIQNNGGIGAPSAEHTPVQTGLHIAT